jgi:hypothetical protein
MKENYHCLWSKEYLEILSFFSSSLFCSYANTHACARTHTHTHTHTHTVIHTHAYMTKMSCFSWTFIPHKFKMPRNQCFTLESYKQACEVSHCHKFQTRAYTHTVTDTHKVMDLWARTVMDTHTHTHTHTHTVKHTHKCIQWKIYPRTHWWI